MAKNEARKIAQYKSEKRDYMKKGIQGMQHKRNNNESERGLVNDSKCISNEKPDFVPRFNEEVGSKQNG